MRQKSRSKILMIVQMLTASQLSTDLDPGPAGNARLARLSVPTLLRASAAEPAAF